MLPSSRSQLLQWCSNYTYSIASPRAYALHLLDGRCQYVLIIDEMAIEVDEPVVEHWIAELLERGQLKQTKMTTVAQFSGHRCVYMGERYVSECEYFE
jgi:hypothetical protein